MQELAAARAAFAARHWTGAHDGFLAARQDGPLDADDLSALATASWWLGLMDESIAVREEAYERYLEASDHRRAASQCSRCRRGLWYSGPVQPRSNAPPPGTVRTAVLTVPSLLWNRCCSVKPKAWQSQSLAAPTSS